MKIYKPKVVKLKGCWVVLISPTGHTPKRWIKKAEEYTQCMNCRELFKQT